MKNPQRRLADQLGGDTRPKVLLVDDQPLNLAFAAAELEDLCQPLLVTNGEDALRLALAEQPDLILLDVRMPGIDGFEVCRRLKSDPSTAAATVIFLTVLDEETDEELGLNLGAIDYISKPFSPAILRARVRNHLLSLRQRRQLERIAMIDALTGIANRRSFNLHMQMAWQEHQASGQPLALLLMDVDFFKDFNDRRGHPAGDLVLQRVASELDRHMQRQEDLVTRYGGEEFACILPRTDTAGARLVGEKLRQAVLDLRMPHPASTAADCVTISIGVASCVPQAGAYCTSLVEVTDRCLYQAKQTGRNRVAAP